MLGKSEEAVCSVAECGRPSRTKGLCCMHYTRLYRHGDTSVVLRVHRYSADARCSVTSCKNKPTDSGLCGMHGQRVRRYGDPNYVTTHEEFQTKCRMAQLKRFSTAKGYRRLYGRHEHRVVAEAMLGRPLVKGEIVHHKDGNKRNNAPENLEVMTQSQHITVHLKEAHATHFCPSCGHRHIPKKNDRT